MITEIFTALLKVGHGNYIFMLGLFIAFIYIVKKSIKTLIHGVYVGIGSALFPVALNLAGYNIPLTLETISSFVLIGLGMFFVYVLFRSIYHILGIGSKVVSGVSYPFRRAEEKKKDKRIEKLLKKEKHQDEDN